MPYAVNNKISQDPIEGGIEITEAQYLEARKGMMQGKVVSIDGGFSVADPVVPQPDPVPAPKLTPEQKQAALEAKVQELLDAQARSMNFDNIISAVSNASLPVGEYRQADGAALLLWRARVWQKAAEIRDAFLAGERPEPTWEEVEAELPEYPIA